MKARLLSEKAEILRPVPELREQRDAYLSVHLSGLSAEQLQGLLNKVKSSPIEIRQINNPDAGIVDRCQSCYLGIREPVVLTRKDMGGERDRMARAFTSHPDMELLRIHDPEKLGCTPCHGGNGMQVASVQSAHGNYEHWLWPPHPKANYEAGCHQCHASDMVVDRAPVLSLGKELFE
jgi:hypothetical protein